jgi:Tfp pilus assembly protein PilN
LRSLNLASRPFRNQRLPSLLAVVSLVAALVLTAYHVMLARDVMPDRTSALTMKLADMEAESGRLRTEARSLGDEKPDAASLAEWTRLKDLVDKRVFSWTSLFAILEDTLPDGVRLVSLSPKVEKGQVTLQIVAVSRTFEEALDFHRALEERPEFSQVWPQRRANPEQGGIEYEYTMGYVPSAHTAVAPPSPAPATAAPPANPPASASARMLP